MYLCILIGFPCIPVDSEWLQIHIVSQSAVPTVVKTLIIVF
jgi:hypothetical protein